MHSHLRRCAILPLFLVAAVPAAAERRTERYNGHEAVASEIIVKFRARDGSGSAQAQRDTDSDTAVRLSQTHAIYLLHSRSRNVPSLIETLKNRPEVEYVEPNYVVHASAVPNDAQYSNLWGLRNYGQLIVDSPGKAGADVGAAAAWDLSTGSTANVIGVLDTGIDYTHADLAANAWSAPSAFTVTLKGMQITCPAGSHGFNAFAMSCDPRDDGQHGTHVSGTIGAAGNNSIGVVGVNWTTRIMGLKMLDAAGSGTTGEAITVIEFANQVKRIFGAAANVRVLSASWGGSGYSQALADAIAAANTAEMLFVAAAGNAHTNNDQVPQYPANLASPNVISVAATTNIDGLTSFSNYGTASVHLGAPGLYILSTIPGGGYGWMSGTSMATPHVSGAAMLVLSRCSLNTAQLKAILLQNVDVNAELATLTSSGGRLNVNRALRACTGTTPAPAPAPAPQPAQAISLWRDTDVPPMLSIADRTEMEAGVKFRADVNGYVTGIRFYKGP
ncbi:MAG TPA: S8 family serine peptidase, partial [Bryobacteraceae bacterium]|nr:S8 family serine peptidase [Bryobacteraceae bacterium]